MVYHHYPVWEPVGTKTSLMAFGNKQGGPHTSQWPFSVPSALLTVFMDFCNPLQEPPPDPTFQGLPVRQSTVLSAELVPQELWKSAWGG